MILKAGLYRLFFRPSFSSLGCYIDFLLIVEENTLLLETIPA